MKFFNCLAFVTVTAVAIVVAAAVVVGATDDANKDFAASKELLQNGDFSMVLVPSVSKDVRFKRSAEDKTSPKKFKRLAHSVYVKSDIRYR